LYVNNSHIADRWLSLGTPVSSTNKTDHYDITEIVLKVTLNTIKLTLLLIKKTDFQYSNFNLYETYGSSLLTAYNIILYLDFFLEYFESGVKHHNPNPFWNILRDDDKVWGKNQH
jgi:hypothetical protein